jgi:DNA-binding NarL/FixJ family response regulator
MINLFIVDDHMVIIEGLVSILHNNSSINIAGSASTGEDCIKWFELNKADVILMDISLPDISGLELCTYMKQKYPGVAILALSTFNEASYITKMMANGADGYVLKNVTKAELTEGIHKVVNGETYLSFEVSKIVKASENTRKQFPHLTRREKEILQLIVNGLTNIEIGKQLFISLDTVDTHRKNLYAKLNVKNAAMLVRITIENNLL